MRESTPFRLICSFLKIERLIYRLTLIRIVLQALPKVCRGSVERPLPRGFVNRIVFVITQFFGFLSIYRMLVNIYDLRKKEKNKRTDDVGRELPST